MKTLSISACRRPEALRETLVALKACLGVGQYSIKIYIDHSEDMAECMNVAVETAPSWSIVEAFHKQMGCNKAIRECMNWGFRRHRYDPLRWCKPKFHVHLEDDTVPAPGFLQWMEWAAVAFEKDSGVLAVSGHQNVPDGQPDEYVLQRAFNPWGWGTWLDRWDAIDRGWHTDGNRPWDTSLNKGLAVIRKTARPCISRIQNIGKEKGAFMDPNLHELYAKAHTVHEGECTDFKQRTP